MKKSRAIIVLVIMLAMLGFTPAFGAFAVFFAPVVFNLFAHARKIRMP